MTIRLHMADLPISSVGFNYSILGELLLSLKVLNSYRHHPLHINWALATSRQLSPALRSQNGRFHPIIATLSALFLVQPNNTTPDFAQELTRIANQTPTQFAEMLLNDFLIDAPPNGRRIWENQISHQAFCQSAELQAQAQRWLTQHYGASADIITQLCQDPAQLQQAVLQLIQAYWDSFFEEEWAKLEPLLLNNIQACGQRLMQDGILQMIKPLSKRFSIHEETQTITYVSNGPNETRTLSTADALNLYPTYFTYPAVIFSFKQAETAGNLTISITYPIAQQQLAGQAPMPSAQLVSLLRALADSTRLQILQLAAQKPRSTSELAGIIGVSDAAISKQLKQMQQAGWVTAKRKSYYVLYSAQQAPLAQLSQSLASLFKDEPILPWA